MKPPATDKPIPPAEAAMERASPVGPATAALGEPSRHDGVPSSPHEAAAAPPPPVPPAPPPEEVDVWWGSFAGRTMLPSFLVCGLATVLIAWWTWAALPGHLFKITFLSLASVLWLFQGIRWGYRYFGYNYRLTNRRLFCHRGFLYYATDEVELTAVAQVVVKCSWWERSLKIGQILILAGTPVRQVLILKGVCKPARIAESIRVEIQRAREQSALVQPPCPT